MRPGRARGSLAAALAAALLPGCAPAERPTVACDATQLEAAGPADTLAIHLVVGVPTSDGQVEVLARVDPLDERGAVSFSAPPPPAAAAAALAVTADAVFQGCIGQAPGAFRLVASEAPLGRLWLRVSADRPVVVHAPTLAGAPSGGTRSMLVLPGGSERARWTIDGDSDR